MWDGSEAPQLAPFQRQVELNIQIVRSFLDTPTPADRIEIMNIHEDLFLGQSKDTLKHAQQLVAKGHPLNLGSLAAIGCMDLRAWLIGLHSVVPMPARRIRDLHSDLRIAYHQRMGSLPGKSRWGRQAFLAEIGME